MSDAEETLMAASVPFGPGTMTIGATPLAFDCEVLGGKVTHTYAEVGAARTMLCGTERPVSQKRTDGLTFNLENDLTASGLYQYLITNDLTEVPFTYEPNTDNGASWAGTVQLTLPADIGADEFGAPIISSVSWAGVGAFTFTAGTGGALLAADEETATKAA
jgi:hypothetical protein